MNCFLFNIYDMQMPNTTCFPDDIFKNRSMCAGHSLSILTYKGKPESVVVKLLPKVRRVDMEKVICPVQWVYTKKKVLWRVVGVENFLAAFVEVARNGAHIGFKWFKSAKNKKTLLYRFKINQHHIGTLLH